MKTYKNTTISVAPTTIDNQTSTCHNLQKSTTSNALVPIAPPTKIIDGNYTPIHHYAHNDGSFSIFLISGTTLSIMKYDGTDFSTPTEITTLDTTPLCGANSGKSIFLMMPDGAYRLDYDENNDRWIDLGIMPQFPAIKIIATNTTSFSATTPSFSLSTTYHHWQGTLNKTDQKTLTSALLYAYDELQHNASSAGFFLQPILARYHLLDDNGNALFSSSPTMISTPGGFQCVNLITFSTSDFATIDSHTLTATGFQIGVETNILDNSPWSGIVAKVVVETTPILDPIDAKSMAQCRLEKVDNTSGKIAVYMPGTSITMVSSSATREAMVKNAIISFEDIACEIAQYPNPFVAGITSGKLSPLSNTGKTIISDSYPFTASVATHCGDTILWGNITPLHHFAPSIGNITATQNSDSGFWRAYISVRFSNSNDVVVWSGEGENNCPSLLSPLIAYPDKNASEVTIAISCGDKIYRQSFPLTPIAGSDYAVYIHSSLAPFALDDVAHSFIIPTQYIASTTQWGAIAVSRLENPLMLTSKQQISEGSIVAITPAVRSSSLWDFARTHAYAFTSSGIYATSVNAARTFISAHIIDNRMVKNTQSVAFANNAVYAVAANDLISISGSKSATVKPNAHINGIIWNNNSHSLLGTASGVIAYFFDFTDNNISTCDMPIGSSPYDVSGTPLIYNNEAIYCILPSSPSSINIAWNHTILIRDSMQRLSQALFFISATHFNGTISIRAHSGAGVENSYPITTLKINGAINHPIPVRIYAPPRPYISISIEGNASTDFAFNSIQLKFSP